MPDYEHIPKFDIESLTALSARLTEHADAVLARKDTERDLRQAASACQQLAHLRFRIDEIASNAIEQPHWDAASFARDIKAVLNETAHGGP